MMRKSVLGQILIRRCVCRCHRVATTEYELMWIALYPMDLSGAAVKVNEKEKEMRSRVALFCSVHCMNLQTALTPIADTLSLNLLLSLTSA
jgi:hypothetical protein